MVGLNEFYRFCKKDSFRFCSQYSIIPSFHYSMLHCNVERLLKTIISIGDRNSETLNQSMLWVFIYSPPIYCYTNAIAAQFNPSGSLSMEGYIVTRCWILDTGYWKLDKRYDLSFVLSGKVLSIEYRASRNEYRLRSILACMCFAWQAGRRPI